MKPKHSNPSHTRKLRNANETPYYFERRRERTKKGMRRNAAALATLGIQYGHRLRLKAGRIAAFTCHRVSLGGRTYLIHPAPGKRYRLELAQVRAKLKAPCASPVGGPLHRDL